MIEQGLNTPDVIAAEREDDEAKTFLVVVLRPDQIDLIAEAVVSKLAERGT